MLERDVHIAGLIIVKLQMPLAEGAAAAILAAEPHRRSFQHQRSESEGFGERPIHRRAVQYFFAFFDKCLELGMNIEALWKLRDTRYNLLNKRAIDGRLR